jgi:hypothetical protein
MKESVVKEPRNQSFMRPFSTLILKKKKKKKKKKKRHKQTKWRFSARSRRVTDQEHFLTGLIDFDQY